jgi:hypothetical protein
MQKLSMAIAATVLLALSPVGAQESREPKPYTTDRPQTKLTLQIQDQSPLQVNNQSLRETNAPKVRDVPFRPHGRSRIDPAPPQRPLIDPKRM